MTGAVVHSELLGHAVRADPWPLQGRSSYQRARAAVSNGDFEAAAALGRLTVQEAQEAYDLFSAWLVDIPRVLESHGVDPDVIAEGLDAAAREIGDVDIARGWEAYVELVDDFADACRRRDAKAASDSLERARAVWQRHHDPACDTICALFGFAREQLGEAFVGELWDELLSTMYTRSARIYAPEALPWDRAVERLLLDIFEATRGHLCGPRRDGEFTVREEDERWVVSFAPCGSGGRAMQSTARARAVTTAEHDWAWNTTGVCLYCAHCCQLQQRAPIQRLGFPLRVITPPVAGQGVPVCTWSIYKDRRAIPDAAYTSVGFEPPQNSTSRSTRGGVSGWTHGMEHTRTRRTGGNQPSRGPALPPGRPAGRADTSQ